MNEIVMIPIGQLWHHPENPRKDLGDLTELAESIRKNGIMQNLTVVSGRWRSKDEYVQDCMAEGVTKDAALGTYDSENSWTADGYTVVIGNRRMEAAKIAGMAELPCVISGMDHKTQISTMLEENMQRADLTVYEQAQGFQMMMDLGYSAKEISEKTGFGETTVRRRIKMAEMDPKLLKKACEAKDTERQITMFDFDRLAQVESVKERNALLKEIGESNFDWKMRRALKIQQANKMKPVARKAIQEAKLKKLNQNERYNGKYKQLWGSNLELDKWDGKKPFIPKVDEELFYDEDDTDIIFFVKEKKQKNEAPKKSAAEVEKEKQIDLAWKTVERVAEASADLRRKFAEGMTVSPKNAMRMMQWALIASFAAMMSYETPTLAIQKKWELNNMSIPERIEKMSRIILDMPQKQWPRLMLMMFEGEKEPKTLSFTWGGRYDFPKYDRKRKLEICYEWLTEFGYQMSDEEIQMMSGTHPVFQKEAEDE
ncbi:MAG: ParB N-terminal domain-containing protein [Clostridia bacterium]|nr:ParB N-terminal domain-containing protein [Clostridia bacterium]